MIKVVFASNMKAACLCLLFAVYLLPPTLSVDTCRQGGKEHPPGSEWTVVVDGECKGYSCSDDGQISLSECPKYKLREGCSLTKGALCEPYPDCCPKPLCP